MEFEWDVNKAKLNEQKHKVTFLEACYIFSDPYILTTFDDSHSDDQDRWVSLGISPNGKLIVVVHAYRLIDNEEIMRLISARLATKHEMKQYYKRRKPNEERI